MKSIISSLKNEDLDSLLIALNEEGGQENPLLLAAESGSYKILKSIVEIGPVTTLSVTVLNHCMLREAFAMIS